MIIIVHTENQEKINEILLLGKQYNCTGEHLYFHESYEKDYGRDDSEFKENSSATTLNKFLKRYFISNKSYYIRSTAMKLFDVKPSKHCLRNKSP